MNPDDEDAVINQLKYPRLAQDFPPRFGLDFVQSLQNRSLQHHGKCVNLQAFAEDELVRKEYKEAHCEIPGVPRSTFLMVFSPDGTKVASTHGNHNIYITDLRTGKNIKTLVGHPRTPWCIAFHPSYNDIIASGCLGGQVRIWDLTGGSELWTAENETVIASIAFHPIDRMLVIATFNELHFWDWRTPSPFACVATTNAKEKVRYVEFDRMGHKLITGITNVPPNRWDGARNSNTPTRPERNERCRFPLTPPSPPDRTANNYRRRVVVPRVLSTYNPYTYTAYSQASTSSGASGDRVPLSSVPERERRITACYRNLVHEYELLVHRYLQVYSPPATIDRGTDPMEIEQPTSAPSSSATNVAVASTSFSTEATTDTNVENSNEPSVSTTVQPPETRSDHFRIFLSRFCRDREALANRTAPNASPVQRQLLLRTTSLLNNSNNDSSEPSTSNASSTTNDTNTQAGFKMRIKCSPKQNTPTTAPKTDSSPHVDTPKPSSSLPTSSRRTLWVAPHKRVHPGFTKTKKNNRKPILITSSENSSSDDEVAPKQPANVTSEDGPSGVATNNASSAIVEEVNVTTSLEDIPNEPATSEGGCARTDANIMQSCTEPVGPGAQGGCARTSEITQPCARTLGNTNTSTTNTAVYMPSGVFILRNDEQQIRTPTDMHRFYPRSINTSTVASAQDEVINYAERSNFEDDLIEQPASEFHPFDPPPEFPSINPENIGIGNMYSHIVQDLESSLNNVRNIRASARPGETSDMLSTFSDRLESIMHQSDSILRNLSNSVGVLPAHVEGGDREPEASPVIPILPGVHSVNVVEDAERTFMSDLGHVLLMPEGRNPAAQQPLVTGLPPPFVLHNNAVLYSDPSFYMRGFNHPNSSTNPLEDLVEGSPQETVNRNAVASDHSYHAGIPIAIRPQQDNFTPLMTSLHLTISHIRRQARLLRRQVDSIERLDRAMLEVQQLQTMRQLFRELRRHISNLAGEHRSTGVSSVRQMMAGTRISDSSPCDSGAEPESSPPPQTNPATSSNTDVPPPTRPHNPGRKQLPPSRLLHLQRQHRRFAVVNMLPRRYNARNRSARQRLLLRSFSIRHNRFSEFPDHFGTGVTTGNLAVMIRRLESHLTSHIAVVVRTSDPNPSTTSFGNHIGEVTINQRLNLCRVRLNRIINSSASNDAEATSNVTPDGVSRFTARNTLSRILETLTLFLSQNGNNRSIPHTLHIQIRNVIDLTSLLSDILLLQIVDSIPPPTGINLDPERESLTASIDEMCRRMLQRRIIGQSQTLNRSLRLMRLSTHSAAHALHQQPFHYQTYNSRYDAIFTNTNSSRTELLGQIHSTLRSIRNRGMYYVQRNPGNTETTTTTATTNPAAPPQPHTWSPITTVWSRVSDSNSSGATQDVSNSDDDNDSWHSIDQRQARTANNANESWSTDQQQSLYRTANVNLVDANEPVPASNSSLQNRLWNVPAVRINDVPFTETFGAWQNRISQHRYRLSDLRSNPMLNLFRPRFLHPLYTSGPLFEGTADMEDRRQDLHDGDAISMTFTPNHRIQAWDVSTGDIPEISNSTKNIVVAECKIHNDASVDISSDGTLLVTLLPSGGYLNVTNRLGVYSLNWETLGQMLYVTSFEQNVVSVSLSPLSRYLVVGMASRRVSIIPSKWTMARIFLLTTNEYPYGSRLPLLRELEQTRDTNYMSLNCIRWLPVSGQGLILATNTGQLRILS